MVDKKEVCLVVWLGVFEFCRRCPKPINANPIYRIGSSQGRVVLLVIDSKNGIVNNNKIY